MVMCDAALTAMCGLAVSACGSHMGAASHSGAGILAKGATAEYVKGDGDDDPYNPLDDRTVRAYGQRASAGERRAVSVIVKRYFQTAAQGDGARACKLLSTRLARRHDLSSVVPSDYSSPKTMALRGKPCAQFMDGLFAIDRQQIAAADPASVVVTSARVKGRIGLAVLGFRIAPERQIRLRLEHRAWKMDALLDLPIP
jgi:hypothetical protein